MYNKLGAWTTIDDNTVTTGSENALKVGTSLACLEIRYEMRRRFYTEQD